MSGRLLEQARIDAIKFISTGGFEEEISLSKPDNSLTVLVNGLHTKHWMSFDTEGSVVNSKNAHILISEQVLNAAGYVTRNINTGNVDLRGHKIAVKDSTNLVKNYIIDQSYPSETFGLIVCILADFKP